MKLFRILFASATIGFFAFSHCLAQPTASPASVTYQSYWKKIDEYTNQSLPKSALYETQKVYALAKKEGNSPMMLKAMVSSLSIQHSITPDSMSIGIKRTEKLLSESKDPIFSAFCHSVLANVYLSQYQSVRWKIDRRTALAGVDTTIMEEWTGDRYKAVILAHIRLSLQDKALLSTTSTEGYQELLTKGKDSPRFRKTVYDLLAYQAINNLESISSDESNVLIMSIHDDLCAIHLESGNREALVLAALSKLNFVYRDEQNSNAFEQALLELQQKNIDLSISTEVSLRLVQYYRAQNDSTAILKALTTCDEVLQRFPKYERIGLVKNQKEEILMPNLQINLPKQIYPSVPTKLGVKCKNVKQIQLCIYRLNLSSNANPSDINAHYPRKKVQEQSIQIRQTKPYLQVDSLFKISMAEVGIYLAEVVGLSDQAKGDTARVAFSVSRIGSVSRSINGMAEVLAADFWTGKLLPRAEVVLYDASYFNHNNQKEVERIKDGENGIYSINKTNETYFYKVVQDDDVFQPFSSLPYTYTPTNQANEQQSEQIFSDRKLYRPGQKVYFKGMAFRNFLGGKQEVVADKQIDIQLVDANGSKVSKQTFKTNAYGSYAGEFMLPKSALNGTFMIATANAVTAITVAEYKLPKFKIDLLGDTKTYQFGDKISITGKAETFSGLKIAGGDVVYKVVRRRHWFCWWVNSPEKIVASGKIKTDARGEFVVSFVPEKGKNEKIGLGRWLAYNYSIEASLTDATGETQRTELGVPVGDVSMVLTSNLPQNIEREQLPAFEIQAQNLTNKAVAASGTYRLYRFNTQTWEAVDEDTPPIKSKEISLSGSFDANKPLDISGWKNLQSGEYQLNIESKDEQGRLVTAESKFTLFSNLDKQPPTTTYFWKHESVTACKIGESAVVLVGSSSQVEVLYEVFDSKGLVDRSRFSLSNSVKKIAIPYLSTYGNAISAHFSIFKNGKFFHEQVAINRIEEDNRLNLRWNSFRKKQIPGQKETWKLVVRDKADRPLQAEVLAEMYDLALDRIEDYQPQFLLPKYLTTAISPWISNGDGYQNQSGWQNFKTKNYSSREFSFDQLLMPEFSFGRNRNIRIRGARSLSAPMIKQDNSVVESDGVLNEVVTVGYGVRKMDLMGSVASIRKAEKAPEPPKIAIRQKFGETAFFYPQLITDKSGEVSFSFTLPENLTEWKFIGRAHTPDLQLMQLVDTVISRKELMIEPFVPRFVRVGDQLVITAKVSNLSAKSLNGNVRMEFFNPFTDQLLTALSGKSLPFLVKPDSSQIVSWQIAVPANEELLGFRFMAESETFSDGEEQVIPILPNRQLITESYPVNFQKSGDKTVILPAIKSTQTDYRVTVEAVSNPAWYAVQALPAITIPKSWNLISWFSAYYANAIASHIVQSNPSIEAYLKSVSMLPDAPETQRSKLEKNQTLKSVVLEETPWVSAAKTETEQIQRLSELLDKDRSQSLADEAMKQLAELQLPSGGFAWYKQMQASSCLTSFVLAHLTHLQNLGAADEKNAELRNEIVKNAIRFMDEDLRTNFAALQKYNRNWQALEYISFSQLQNLVTRSFYPKISMSKAVAEATTFYQRVAQRHWTKASLHQKALTLQWMVQLKNRDEAAKILRSIKEFAVESDEMGMSFPSIVSDYRFGQSALLVHISILEAFDAFGGQQSSIEKMKLWLLKQKQTEQWTSLPETVDATYALINRGANLLSANGKIEVKVGDQTIISSNPASPKFEYQAEIAPADLSKANRSITFQKSSAGVAWGTVYRQYFENMDQIKKSTGAMSISKQLFVETTTNNQLKLVPITTNNPLKIGDKVVARLVVKTDRDLNFVDIKDTRAACLEPLDQVSGFRWQESLPIYLETKDASTHYFIQDLSKGTYVFEYRLWVTRTGEYTSGAASVQCLYAPEFVANSQGSLLIVK